MLPLRSLLILALISSLWSLSAQARDVDLLHVSYDPTREFYQAYNTLFAEHWRAEKGESVRVRMSHGGSGRQALSVIQGLPADIVSLALAYDIDMIAQQSRRLPATWQQNLPEASAPYHSTVVFLVRKGNPKQIHDWSDLIQEGVEIITPNPKTSGGARWNYLAAWGFALQQEVGDLTQWQSLDLHTRQQAELQAEAFVRQLYQQVLVMDTGARAATNSFVDRGLGDVLLAWENEALMALEQLESGEFELVYPSLSIRAEPPVAVVSRNAERRGTEVIAQAYLEYLYSEAAQTLIAQYHFRSQTNLAGTDFPQLTLFRLEQLYPSWQDAHQAHFASGARFDRLSRPQ
ncbi:sulfate ABC transporter substrate-binding protein [Nitrincola tapanii]|uniref:Sulfate ABC transporter substrate-binding protein n=1 Tax=Nitrincola tapanii TaxID=1708751 RepID=A0A5A9W443_9GAMM|nr:sulfate ABC transporter substrate-binding protein [Nitrincola tapanii]KAA0875477.1 sulfate ABC transporter substrate-binding protein [Nitrincola tapanii]